MNIYKLPKKLAPQTKAERTRLELVQNVIVDYEDRKLKRRQLELQWRLNLDFFTGRQNNVVTNFDTVMTIGKQYHWQQRDIFNHIAPIIEGRLAHIANAKAELGVLPSSGEDEEVVKAKLCEKVLNSINLDSHIEQATMWSEVTGTAFYKVYWDQVAGSVVGMIDDKAVTQGDVRISVCSPFEIYPDNIYAGDINEVHSLIHAKNICSREIQERWGVDLSGVGESVTVTERYERPTGKRKNGRFTVVAGDKLLHDGELPFVNGIPFVRQTSEAFVGSFFGKSVIERAIPVQRAYNAVKNRKVEFLNRLACGVMAVEEGSVDLDSLENDGLAPGKIIVYRQGMAAPRFIDTGSLPAELEREEERLLREFDLISGGADVIRASEDSGKSGVALSILVEQNDRRLARTVNSVKRAKCLVAMQILGLYQQFCRAGHVARVKSGDSVQLVTFDSDDIRYGEVVVV